MDKISSYSQNLINSPDSGILKTRLPDSSLEANTADTSEIRYSSKGKDISSLFGKRAASEKCTGNQKIILREGFKSILKNPDTTSSEKTLAELGMEILTSKPEIGKDYLNTGLCIMDAICGCSPGPLNKVISGIILASLRNSTDIDNSDDISDIGFKAISRNKNTSYDTKSIAEFGSSIVQYINSKASIEDIVNAKIIVLDAISQDANIHCGSLIADIAAKASESARSSDGRKNILLAGFNSIINNRNATDMQKAIASFGAGIAGTNSCLFDEDVSKSSLSAMKKIPVNHSATITDVIAGLTIDSLSQSKKIFNKKNAIFQGLKTIAAKANTTRDEKLMASLGLVIISGIDNGSRDIESAGKTFVEYFSNNSGKINFNLMTSAACDSIKKIYSEKRSRNILSDVLNFIINDSRAGQKQKNLAAQGLKDSESLTDGKAGNIMMKSLKQIITSSETESKEELDDMQNGLNNSTNAEPVEVNDEYVNIGGIKIKIQKPQSQ